jgi:hypothetical protein
MSADWVAVIIVGMWGVGMIYLAIRVLVGGRP